VRRLLVAANDGQQIVIDLAGRREAYDLAISGVVRAREGSIAGTRLLLEGAAF